MRPSLLNQEQRLVQGFLPFIPLHQLRQSLAIVEESMLVFSNVYIANGYPKWLKLVDDRVSGHFHSACHFRRKSPTTIHYIQEDHWE